MGADCLVCTTSVRYLPVRSKITAGSTHGNSCVVGSEMRLNEYIQLSVGEAMHVPVVRQQFTLRSIYFG